MKKKITAYRDSQSDELSFSTKTIEQSRADKYLITIVHMKVHEMYEKLIQFTKNKSLLIVTNRFISAH